jgi:hypothetical protein
MKEEEPKPIIIFKAVCATHGELKESVSAMGLFDVMNTHLKLFEYKCKGMEIKTFVNGKECGGTTQ